MCFIQANPTYWQSSMTSNMDMAHDNIHIHKILELGGIKSVLDQQASTPQWETWVAQQ